VLAGLSGDLAKGVAIAINSLKAINATLNMVKGCFGIAVGAADIAGDL
jgi:hypothetical protein